MDRKSELLANINDKSYNARLYADRIEVKEISLSIRRKDIKKTKIKFRSKVSLLLYDGTIVLIPKNKNIIAWLDPLYSLKWASIYVIFLVSLFAAAMKFSLFNIIPAILYAFFGAGSAYYLYSIINRPIVKITQNIFFLALLVCLPPLYLFPFSVPVFGGFSLAILIFLFLEFFTEKKRYHRVYLSLAWIMLVYFFYFWVSWGIKQSNDSELQPKVTANIMENPKYLLYDAIQWTPPYGWKTENADFLELLGLQHRILFQVAPVSIQFILNAPAFSRAGWIGITPSEPKEFYTSFDNYLEKQQEYLWGKLEMASVLATEKWDNGFSGYLRVYGFQSMDNHEKDILYVLTVPFAKEKKIYSWVFVFTLPEGGSPDYYLDLIMAGFSAKR